MFDTAEDVSYDTGMTATAAGPALGDTITGSNDSGTYTGKVVELIPPGSRFSRWDQGATTLYRIDSMDGWLRIVKHLPGHPAVSFVCRHCLGRHPKAEGDTTQLCGCGGGRPHLACAYGITR